jgi:hypothetical protein
LNISEIGIVVEDVPSFVQEMQALGVPTFGEHGNDFAPLGTDEGLLIVVKRGRKWYPEGLVPANINPDAVIFVESGKIHRILLPSF